MPAGLQSLDECRDGEATPSSPTRRAPVTTTECAYEVDKEGKSSRRRTAGGDFTPPGSPGGLHREASESELYWSARRSFGGELQPEACLRPLEYPIRKGTFRMVMAQDWYATDDPSGRGQRVEAANVEANGLANAHEARDTRGQKVSKIPEGSVCTTYIWISLLWMIALASLSLLYTSDCTRTKQKPTTVSQLALILLS